MDVHQDSPMVLEIQRLTALLPKEARSQVGIGQAGMGQTGMGQTGITQSKVIDPDLIATQQVSRQKYWIHIDFHRWQSLNPDQRNLLLWHEVARIQGQSVRQSLGENVVLGIGGVALLTELLAQNLLGVVTTLAVTGLAGYQLYQHYWGERALRAVSAADQAAIELAMQFGYSFADAYDSLCSAIQTLAKWKSQTSRWKKYSHWKKYQVRLSVLEMLSAKVLNKQYQGLSLCN